MSNIIHNIISQIKRGSNFLHVESKKRRPFFGFGSGGSNTPTAFQYIVAEGGIATRDGLYIVRTFPAGTWNLVVTSNLGGYELEYLAGAAAGAGGGTNNGGAAGGGGGDVVTGTFVPTVRSYAMTVGVGGATQGVANGLSGGNTTFEIEGSTLNLLGGGGGGSGNNSINGDGLTGGSGGGMGYNRPTLTGLATGLGNNGGDYVSGDGGTGGGGMGSAGVNGTSAIGSNGGTGLASSISGTLKYYGAGGGGGSFVQSSGGLGGNNTGGNGGYGTASVNIPATTPVANSCSGGGGAGNAGGGGVKVGSAGADGVVIVRYLSPEPIEVFDYDIILENNDFT